PSSSRCARSTTTRSAPAGAGRSRARSSRCSWTPCAGARSATRSGTRSCRSRPASPRAVEIQLYDTTLRDGMQGGGLALSAAEKLRVAPRLDALGIDLIEAGFPASNPKELELFDLLGREAFDRAEIAAFGMTRRRDVAADADPALRVLADSFAP